MVKGMSYHYQMKAFQQVFGFHLFLYRSVKAFRNFHTTLLRKGSKLLTAEIRPESASVTFKEFIQ